MPEAALTVSQLTNAIKQLLEPQFSRVTVTGEVSNLKVQSSGHIYFSLKDEEAQISCVMFRGQAATLQAPLKIGDHVVAHGELSIYAPRGNYQLIIRSCALVGLGELLLKLEQLKKKLAVEGLFDPVHKKPLPLMPKRIGVVTSPTGAVIRDIINILTRRLGHFHLILNPVRVQGEDAAQEIAQAIEEMNRYQLADVLIVGRGGGSFEELMPFNDEAVARAIFASTIPVISAVGHETDTTIADYVADIRAPTPSAAAELVSFERHKLLDTLARAHRQITQLALKRLREPMQRLDDFREQATAALLRAASVAKTTLTRMRRALEMARPSVRLQQYATRLQQLNQMLPQAALRLVTLRRQRLAPVLAHLKAINPTNLLQRGYSILFSGASVVTSIHALQPSQAVRIRLADGQAHATIEGTTP